MTSALLKKAGYRLEWTQDKITIVSSQRPREFIVATILTLLIGLFVYRAELNENSLMSSFQIACFILMVASPYFGLFLSWRKTVVIQAGRVQISEVIKGRIDCTQISTLDLETDESFFNNHYTVRINDKVKGVNKLFIVRGKAKDVEQLDELVNQIRAFIGLENSRP